MQFHPILRLRHEDWKAWWRLLPAMGIALATPVVVLFSLGFAMLGTAAMHKVAWDYVAKGVGCGAIALLVVSLPAKEMPALFLPGRTWTRGLVLCAYALPFQLEAAWLLVGMPATNFVLARVLEAVVGLLTLVGLNWFVRLGARLPWLFRAHALTCVLLGLLLLFAITPTLAFLDGLFAMARLPEVAEDERREWTPSDGRPCAVHLSDLHITGRGSDPTRDGKPAGQSLLPAYLAGITELAPQVVAITGDITDDGDPEQWKVAEEMLRDTARRFPVVMAPGNHDLSGAYHRGKQTESQDATERLVRFLELQADLNADARTWDDRRVADVVKMSGEEVAAKARKYIEAAKEHIRKHTREGAAQKGLEVPPEETSPEEWFATDYVHCLEVKKRLYGDVRLAFPLHWESQDKATQVFMLDSSPSASWHLGRSAIGEFDAGEVARLNRLLWRTTARGTATRHVLVLAHHPIVRPSTVEPDLKSAFAFAVLRLRPEDALGVSDLLRRCAIEHPDIDWFWCCGHRHQPHLGRLGGVWMLEAPNLRVPGDEDEGVRVLFERDGRWDVGWRALGR